jgi:hypothetical protein
MNLLKRQVSHSKISSFQNRPLHIHDLVIVERHRSLNSHRPKLLLFLFCFNGHGLLLLRKRFFRFLFFQTCVSLTTVIAEEEEEEEEEKKAFLL